MDQYSRCNNIVVDGITSSMTKRDLKKKCTEFFGKIGIKIHEFYIETYHRFGKSS